MLRGKLRKLFTSVLAGTLLISALAIPASAAYDATENFDVYINAGSVVSSKLAEKGNTGPMWVWVTKRAGSTVNWLPSETVDFRGRSPSGKRATSLGQVNEPDSGDIHLGYLSGFGQMHSYYRMAVQYDNNNPYTHLELTVTWSP